MKYKDIKVGMWVYDIHDDSYAIIVDKKSKFTTIRTLDYKGEPKLYVLPERELHHYKIMNKGIMEE